MDLLLHTCCGPCTVYPLSLLRGEGHRVVGYFYNPNIHPYLEFKRRLDTLREFARREGLELVARDGYDLERYLEAALHPPAGETRCHACYRMRLDETARTAREKGFGRFTTTLLVSPYQKHEAVVEAAREAASRHGVDFYYRDFRPGWREGVARSRNLGLYRQPYCGCIFSEMERYRKEGNRWRGWERC